VKTSIPLWHHPSGLRVIGGIMVSVSLYAKEGKYLDHEWYYPLINYEI